MADILTIQDEERNTLINRGLSLDLKSINYQIQSLFKRYSSAIEKIQGGNLIGKTQFHQIQDSHGISTEYGFGKIVFKNGIDKIDYLIRNRKSIAESLGIDSNSIYENRRDNGLMSEYMSLLDRTYDIGQPDKTMQMYISTSDGNSQPLNYGGFWIDYIMTRDWIDELASNAEMDNDGALSTEPSDHRIEYLSNTIQNIVKDHEILFHKDIEEFKGDKYIDKTTTTMDDGEFTPVSDVDKFNDAMNRLNSFNNLEYGFYELFKPIGGTNEKYLKVKLSTSGDLDISGVVGLSDCEHVEWEYGSMEYLRSLNTGNQRYDFKLSIPFNDFNSVLWWKPDEPEQLEVDEEKEGEIDEPTGFRYYRPYETERFLRWFGTNYVPILDPSTLLKKTICSAPRTSDDVQFNGFYQDATNITARNMDMTRANVDGNTSLSLLSMAGKSTIDVISRPDGQYARFVVSGHQQTSNLAFHLKGRMYNSIQEINHFVNTLKNLRESYINISKKILLMQVVLDIQPKVEGMWNEENIGIEWIPRTWIELKQSLEPIQKPNMIDLLRFRQIDIESISRVLDVDYSKRMEFMQKHLSSSIHQNLIQYIEEFDGYSENVNAFANISLSQEYKEQALRQPLLEMYWKSDDEATQLEMQKSVSMYFVDFGKVTVDDLRDRIETFNNLVVRLPVDTYHNKIASRHIFLDWKCFADGAIWQMVENGKAYENPDTPQKEKDRLKDKRLYVKMDEDGETWKTEIGHGTDKDKYGNPQQHEYTEIYIDPQFTTPLIDYSYCIDDEGNPIHDRWDYWSEADFM